MTGLRSVGQGNVAKQQVEICNRIGDARITFFHREQKWPTALYLGQEDFYNLLLECDPWRVHVEQNMYMGMEIFRVDRAHHLRVT